MRSRYTAFALGAPAYLLDTWHSSTRPSRVSLPEEQRWIGLSIRATNAGSASDSTGTVEFVARYKVHGKGHRLHEISRFKKVNQRWYYLNGDHQ
jgi:SEC-C motif-containing protein